MEQLDGEQPGDLGAHLHQSAWPEKGVIHP